MDPYLYPKTETLKNRANLRDPQELAAFEASATARRLRELRERPLPGAFDADHLRGYHHWIFQDVYAFAGVFRIVTLGKAPVVGELAQWFTPPERLEQEAARICERLARAHYLQGLSRPEFAQQGAKVLADLNSLHPFREGNGRTQRMFLSDLAHQAGHELHFDVVSRERMGRASRQAMQGDVTMMARLLDEITDAERIEPLRRAIAFLESQQFTWNDVYMATTTPGQAYSGTLAGRAGDSFMLRSDRSTLLIGNTRDLDPAVRAGERCSFQATDRRQHVELPAATEADRQAGRESLAGRGIGAEAIAAGRDGRADPRLPGPGEAAVAGGRGSAGRARRGLCRRYRVGTCAPRAGHGGADQRRGGGAAGLDRAPARRLGPAVEGHGRCPAAGAGRRGAAA